MQKGLLIALALAAGIRGQAQLNVQDKGLIYLAPGAVLTVQGDIDSRADISGAGTLLLKGRSGQQINMNGHALFALQLDNDANASLTGDVHINSRLVFSAGRMSLNASDLFLETGASMAGFDGDRFVITNGPGMLVKSGLGADGFVFPLGRDGGAYRPIRLSQKGTVHDLGVRAMAGTLTSAALNLRYEVKAFSQGSDLLGMDIAWDPVDELPGFDRRGAGLWFEEEHATNSRALDGGRWGGNVAAVTRTGIFSIASANTLEQSRVYPNPANTGFYVEVKGKCLLELLNDEGKLVRSRNTTGGAFYFALDRELPEGVFLLRIVRDGMLVETRKIMIVR